MAPPVARTTRTETYGTVCFCVRLIGVTEVADDQGFTAREVQQFAGLTGRQLNDWDGRGALPHSREGTGWRRFSAKQLFILMVCTKLRRRFGVPVERLKFVIERMNDEREDYFQNAVILMANLGVGVWLMTDLEKHFVMDSELKIDEMREDGFFDDEPSALVFVKINPIVDSILGGPEDPSFRLSGDEKQHEVLNELRSRFGVRSAEEFNLLQMIRSGDFRRVEVVAPNGEIETIKATTNRDVTERIEDLLREREYQTLKVTNKAGRVVSIEQQFTVKEARASK